MVSRAFVRLDDRWSRGGLPAVPRDRRNTRVVSWSSPGARVLIIEHCASGTDLHRPTRRWTGAYTEAVTLHSGARGGAEDGTSPFAGIVGDGRLRP